MICTLRAGISLGHRTLNPPCTVGEPTRRHGAQGSRHRWHRGVVAVPQPCRCPRWGQGQQVRNILGGVGVQCPLCPAPLPCAHPQSCSQVCRSPVVRSPRSHNQPRLELLDKPLPPCNVSFVFCLLPPLRCRSLPTLAVVTVTPAQLTAPPTCRCSLLVPEPRSLPFFLPSAPPPPAPRAVLPSCLAAACAPRPPQGHGLARTPGQTALSVPADAEWQLPTHCTALSGAVNLPVGS